MFNSDFYKLNPLQEKAVSHKDGISLILAGAGTGKTHTLINKVVETIKHGAKPANIMLLTFTNKAAREMSERVALYLGFKSMEITCGTFHSTAVKLIKRWGKPAGYRDNFTILDTDDSESIINTLIKELKLEKEHKFPRKNVVYKIISLMRNKALNMREILNEQFPYLSDFENEFEDIYNKYVIYKQRNNSLDFDDLLEGFLKLLENHNTHEMIRSNYSWFFVDEFQDTNKIQNEIIFNLGKFAKSLTVVGDDAQSIYAFRGACFQNILNFPKVFINSKVFTLDINYRSSREILDFSNAIIRNNLYQHEKNLVPFNEGNFELPKICKCFDDNEQSFLICDKINREVKNGKNHSDFAVLYRAHSQSLNLQLTLTRLNIPFKIFSGLKFFQQAHVKDLISFLKVLHNPFDRVSWARILLMIPSCGQKSVNTALNHADWDTKSNISEISETINQSFSKKIRENSGELFNCLKNLSTQDKNQNLFNLITNIMELQFFKDNMMRSYENYENRLDDLNKIADFARTYQSLDDFLNEVSLMTTTEEKEDKNSSDTVVLTTIHQAKGLEWKNVFIIGMAEGYFPSFKNINDIDNIEEERRLFYVASTRAKENLIISFPSYDPNCRHGSKYLKPSSFLEEIDESLYEYYDFQGVYSDNI